MCSVICESIELLSSSDDSLSDCSRGHFELYIERFGARRYPARDWRPRKVGQRAKKTKSILKSNAPQKDIKLPIESFQPGLRVVRTQVILFLKSMSEGCGSDIERL